MADNFLPEEAVWEEGIRQVETTDTVLGGPGGVPNLAPNQLANRTKFLKEKLFDSGQFLEYNATRKYKTGDVCYTLANNEIQYWQWYSNVESLAGKSPLLEANRHVGWSDNTKPFYWVPYTGDQAGMPFYWLDVSAPEWAVMEINVDLPIAVYWRLARRYPDLVNGSVINTGEIRAEFLRVLDQGRGIDENRSVGSYQIGSLTIAESFLDTNYDRMLTLCAGEGVSHATKRERLGFDKLRVGDYSTDLKQLGGLESEPTIPYRLNSIYQETLDGFVGGVSRPSNVARPMAIAI